MARFFVSYSRSVKDKVRKVIELLIASGHEVWWDGDIPVMADWWATILEKIEWCDVLIFVASKNSVQSPYCLTELKYASDRQRPVLPFMMDDPSTLELPTHLPPRAQWLIYDGDPAKMLSQINDSCMQINWQQHKDIPVPRPPEPLTGGKSLAKQFQKARRLANNKKFEDAKTEFGNIKRLDYGEWGTECDEWLGRLNSYATLVDLVDDESTLARARTEWALHTRKYGKKFDPHDIDAKILSTDSDSSRGRYLVGGLLTVILIIIIAILVSQSNNHGDEPIVTKETSIALIATTESPNTPTQTPTYTETPTQELSIGEIVKTLDVEATQAQATLNTELTASARATTYALATQAVIDATATATQWTKTPTPDITASIEAYRTEQAATLTQTWIDSWTPTPTPTHTPSNTPTPTSTPTPSNTPKPSSESIMPTPFAWIEIPAGNGTMQTDETNVTLAIPTESYAISKYPITNAQYAQFIQAGGYDQPQWWTDAGWQRRQQNNWTQPNYWDDNRFNGEDQPVVGVSWYEAIAFSQWLSNVTGENISLPTEAQWQYAAQGDDGRIYPWGNEWDAARLNSSNSIGRTSPVTEYEGKGDSAFGVVDMSGNTWEWTLTDYHTLTHDVNSTETIRRVLRGGSWGYFQDYARAEFRNLDFDPISRGYNIGFRVVRAPSQNH